MTVEDFKNVLIKDSKVNISVQTNSDGSMKEVYNDQMLFNGNSYANVANSEIKFIKIEKKTVYIII